MILLCRGLIVYRAKVPWHMRSSVTVPSRYRQTSHSDVAIRPKFVTASLIKSNLFVFAPHPSTPPRGSVFFFDSLPDCMHIR